MSNNAEYESLVRQVEAQRDHYETLVRIATGGADVNVDGDDYRFLVALGWAGVATEEDDQEYDIDDAAEFAQERLSEDVLSIEGIWKGASKDAAEYVGCEVVVCTGGPHVELDTASGYWIGYWGGQKCHRAAKRDVVHYFDELVNP